MSFQPTWLKNIDDPGHGLKVAGQSRLLRDV
jgi:hypothetical protein